MERFAAALPGWLWSLGLFVIVVVAAIILHGVAYRLL
jgi:hypothetical protein